MQDEGSVSLLPCAGGVLAFGLKWASTNVINDVKMKIFTFESSMQAILHFVHSCLAFLIEQMLSGFIDGVVEAL